MVVTRFKKLLLSSEFWNYLTIVLLGLHIITFSCFLFNYVYAFQKEKRTIISNAVTNYSSLTSSSGYIFSSVDISSAMHVLHFDTINL